MAHRFSLLIVLFLTLSFYPALLHAQYGLPGAENSVFITMTPEHPSPGDTVHLTAESTLLDLSRAQITWSSSEKTIASGRGVTETDIAAGAIGQRTTIMVVATVDTVSATGLATIIPTRIDLLFESDSYTPPFYRGRALPSAGTRLHVLAMPRFVREDGTLLPAASIIYTWKRNDAVVTSVSGLGKFSAMFPSPALFSTDTIAVEAHTSDNTYSGSASVAIPSVEPALALYEDNALFGILYHKALSDQTFIPNIETTLVAVPYFAQAFGPNDPRLQYEWHVNSKEIPPDPVMPSAITLNAVSSNGLATVELSLTHATNYSMSSHAVWNISLESSGSQGQQTGSNDSRVNNPFEQGLNN